MTTNIDTLALKNVLSSCSTVHSSTNDFQYTQASTYSSSPFGPTTSFPAFGMHPTFEKPKRSQIAADAVLAGRGGISCERNEGNADALLYTRLKTDAR